MTRPGWHMIWLCWFVAAVVCALASFATLEWLSWSDGITLSRATSGLPKLWIFALGYVVGGLTWGLAVHFWWHWDPENPLDRRG